MAKSANKALLPGHKVTQDSILRLKKRKSQPVMEFPPGRRNQIRKLLNYGVFI